MQTTQVKYIPLISNSIRKTNNFPSTNLAFCKNAIVSSNYSHLQKQPIISAWKKKRQSGSIRSTKIMLQSAYFIASKFKILPEPLDSILREFGGGNSGNGGGFGFGSGHDWGGFDGFRRKRRKKINWVFFGVIFAILGVGLWLILMKRLDFDVFLGGLGLTLFGFSVNVWKRGVFDWALGFCCCAALVGLFLKEDLQKWARFARREDLKKWVSFARRRKRRLF
ncbi:uncharacterized protein LOC132638792 [Lycium barbarum]|uniref:uncharacterized protein LOC132638792 n=1 Tax=Lycium barbarum TaxID=112863 RepID=UPI00293ECF5A|nr:uncharacterized protein LOC132638792 [Lycium barbarum]